MNPVDSPDLSQFRAIGEEQKTGSRITDLPKNLLGKILDFLPLKNHFRLAQTCRTFRVISKTTLEEKEKKFAEQIDQLTAFLKKILKKVATYEVFSEEIETLIKSSDNLNFLREVLKQNILMSYELDRYGHPVPHFIRGVREHTELEDFSTIEFLDEVLHEYSPIFHLEEEFCSQIPPERVDQLVDRRIQKYGFEQTYQDLLNEQLWGSYNPSPLLFHHRRLLVRHADNPHCRTAEFPKRLNDDKSFVLDIIKRQYKFYHFYASDRLKKDKDIVLAVLHHRHGRPSSPSLYVPDILKVDPEIKAFLEKYPDQEP